MENITPTQKAQDYVIELKVFLEKYDATIDLESDYNSSKCEAFLSLNDGSFHSAEIVVASNEIATGFNFSDSSLKV